MTKNKKRGFESGSALLLTTILLFVVLSLVVSLSYVTVMEQQMSSKTKSSVGSFFNADSGVEWALNKIANVNSDMLITSASAFGLIMDTASGKVSCPDGFGCDLYLLDSAGKVINSSNPDFANLTVSDIKAVRAVGTQTAGDPTQRAIEAAVGATGGGCYTDYSLPADTAVGADCGSGFTVKKILGEWGGCYTGTYTSSVFAPPGSTCDEIYYSTDTWYKWIFGKAYLCCQN